MTLRILSTIVLITLIACCRTHESDDSRHMSAGVITQPFPTYLSPSSSVQTFLLPKGYEIQLVASEPMIEEPVAFVWDGNGRMFVAEMRTYMKDISATDENLPVSRISMLEDTDNNGTMNKHSVFIDSLLLPRMLLTLDDRLVVSETYSNSLYSYRDTDGDGKADEKILLYENKIRDERNLEHQESGLVWNIDNWIYITNPVRFRYRDGILIPDSLGNAPAGQWGIGNDDYGRLYFSFAGGEIPALGFQQNPAYGPLDLNDQLDKGFNEVWPIIATPDVEGGKYRQRADGTLNHFSASCGQSVYRGNKLPENARGDLFICEPAGRLVRRAKPVNTDGKITLRNVYDSSEFLASSDMNFRPVHTATGPDGCLYIADMYRGIIQEAQWTGPGTHIREQILKLKLDQNVGRGRIYRIVHKNYKPDAAPRLLNATNSELLNALGHANGWWRDNAQKLLIVRNDKSVVPELRKMVMGEGSLWDKIAFWSEGPTALARLHALWTLEGLEALDKSILQAAYADNHPEIRKAAVKLSEQLLTENDAETFSMIKLMRDDASADVRFQVILSLRSSKNPEAKKIIEEISTKEQGNELFVVAAKKSLVSDAYLDELKQITANRNEFHKSLILDGADHYIQLCANCHGQDGKGLSSRVAPPLAGSERVKGDKEKLIRILLNGLSGAIDGKQYPAVMPAMSGSSNEYIASVLSYIRTGLGNNSEVIEPADVRKIRPQTEERKTTWTLEELDKLPN